MSIAQHLSSDFPSLVRSRGADYFQQKAVKIQNGDDWGVEAIVKGTRKYNVFIDREDDLVIVNCSCPYFESDGACKHIWATILESDERGHLKGDGRNIPSGLVEERDDDEDFDPRYYDDEYDDEDDEDDEDEDLADDSLPAKIFQFFTPTSQKESRMPSWKDQLASLGRPPRPDLSGSRDQWPPNRRIVYIIDVHSTLQSQNLVLDTLIQERKQDGEWSKPRKQRIPRWQIVEMPEPLDRQIFAMLTGSREQIDYGYSNYNTQNLYDTVPYRYQLSSPLPQIIVPLIAQSGRCYLKPDTRKDELTEANWDSGEAWKFSVQVRRDDEKPDRYKVTGTLHRGEEQLDFAKPVLMLQGGLVFTGENIALLDEGKAFHWVSILRRVGSLDIPEKQIGEFLSQALSEPHPPRIDLPEELRYQEINTTPQPRLTFKTQKQNNRLRARLSFNYTPGSHSQILDYDDPRRGVYNLEARSYLLRDIDAESEAKNKLIEVGLKFSPPNYYEKLWGWEVAPTKLPGVVRKLIAEGWHIEAEGKTFRNPGEIKVHVSSGIDWFELHGSVDFAGTAAKLPELLAALKRGDNMVKLDDGAYGILPEEWMKKYGLFAGLGEAHEDHLRFKKTQVGVLNALLAAQPEADIDETFARARDELKRFEGIKSAESPEGFTGQLRPYQKDGLGWIHFLRQFGFGGCLADDMGLGKTIQVLALLESRRQLREQNIGKDSGKRNGEIIGSQPPSLAVVPKSLVFNWKQEAARFTPGLRVLDHTGQFRQKEGTNFEDYDLIITTYGTLRNDAVVFKDLQFDYIILDEAQVIKNADTASAKAARLLRGDNRLALSGTPVENHLGELWSLFEFLNPGMLGAASVFKLAGGAARNPDEETRKLLAQSLRPFILRRTKEQVAKDLPQKQEQTIFCELEPKQRKLYNELREHYRNSLLKRIENEGIAKSKMHVLEALLRLRQAACHPGLIDKKRIKEPSAKLDMLYPQLVELFEEGHKVLVFSQFTSFLSILREHLDKEQITYEYLDGQTRDRQAHVERFQNDPGCKLFLISLKAGGLGLNLTAAEYVYLLDPWWNPAVEAQAIDRAHRIGQSKRVFAYRIIARDTVEEKVLQLQNTKRDLADAIINADNSLIRDLGRDDLELLLS